MPKVAILDDYARAALEVADWSQVRNRAEITVFDRHLAEDEAVEALQPFDVLCTLRERMALPRTLLARLPNLKLITIVGMSLPNLDLAAASERGILVGHPDYANPRFAAAANGTPETGMGAADRHGAQPRRGTSPDARGRLANHRRHDPFRQDPRPARPWPDRQAPRRIRQGVRDGGHRLEPEPDRRGCCRGRRAPVEKEALFREADVIAICVVLSARTRGLVAASDLALMQPGAYLINISRGPIVDEAALVAALEAGRIAGAGLDVYDVEPLPPDHPLRSLANVTAVPPTSASSPASCSPPSIPTPRKPWRPGSMARLSDRQPRSAGLSAEL